MPGNIPEMQLKKKFLVFLMFDAKLPAKLFSALPCPQRLQRIEMISELCIFTAHENEHLASFSERVFAQRKFPEFVVKEDDASSFLVDVQTCGWILKTSSL